MDGWYYKLFGEQFGPVSFEELVELAKSDSLSVDDEVRFGDVGAWRRAGSIGKLMAHLPYQAGKKTVSATANLQDSDNQNSTGVNEHSTVSQWSEFDTFETAVITEPPKVEDRWWCKILGTEIGPITFEELVEHAKTRTLSSDDEVRFGLNGAWRRAGSIGSIVAHLPFQAGERVITTGPTLRAPQERAPAPAAYRVQVAPAPVQYSAPMPDPAHIAAPAPAPVVKVVVEEPVVAVVPVVEKPAATVPTKVDTRCWCKIQELEYGPVDIAKVFEWAASGRLTAKDFVRVGGQGKYVLASELPDLFPEKAAEPEDTPEEPVAPRRPYITKPATESSMSTHEGTSPGINSNVERSPYAAPSMGGPSSNMGGGGFSAPARPSAPVRKPTPKKDAKSVNVNELLQSPPAIGGGAVVLLALIYFFVLPLVFGSNGPDIKRLKTLQVAFKEMMEVKNESGVTPEKIKTAGDKLEKTAKKVGSELTAIKSKTPAQKKLVTLIGKLKDAAKKDYSKPNSVETDMLPEFGKVATALGLTP